jgi:hypothetical protein
LDGERRAVGSSRDGLAAVDHYGPMVLMDERVVAAAEQRTIVD